MIVYVYDMRGLHIKPRLRFLNTSEFLRCVGGGRIELAVLLSSVKNVPNPELMSFGAKD